MRGKSIAMDGNVAVAQAVKLAKPQVVAAYPITPQTPIVEDIATMISRKEFQASYINVESEHSALCAVIGASAVGARTFTATASAGLALMHEITGVAAGSRFPIVMAVVNRALPSPWSLQCDHSDIMGERDQGWIQLFAETCQEALDFTLIAYRLGEDPDVLLPVMVSLDGFFLSHLTEPVTVPSQEEADLFLKPYSPGNYILDPEEPIAINPLTSSDIYTEIKHQHQNAMETSLDKMALIFDSFEKIFSRKYSPVSLHRMEDAEFAIITLGSMSGTARYVVDMLRAKGLKAGLVRLLSFRPFPRKQVTEAMAGLKGYGVIDRSASPGTLSPLYQEVSASLTGECTAHGMSFIAGLGGRDIRPDTIEKAFISVMEQNANCIGCQQSIWLDLNKEGI